MITFETQIAIGIIIFVLVIQISFFFRTRRNCKLLSNLFPDLSNTNSPVLKVQESLIDSETKKYVDKKDKSSLRVVKLLALKTSDVNISDKFKQILDSTNKYLKNNIDTTAEFNILRDIAERISDAEENKIASSVSLPLYIGLMGTFVGVIFGIVNIVISTDGIGSSIITENSIQAFLSGVFIAMVGSFVGLLLTTVNNSYYFKEAKGICDTNKNLYFNFLQVEILPTLENTLGKNLKEFKENLNAFNLEFSGNIESFKGTIPAITDNIRLQTEFIKSFKEIDIQRLASANLKIFKKLNESAEIFKSFNEYSNSISKNVSRSEELLNKLNDLLDRLADFEKNINEIGTLVKHSDENYALIGEYIVEKLESLKSRYQLIQEFVDKSEDEIKVISNETIDRIKQISERLQLEFDKSFDFANTQSPFTKLDLLDSVNKNLEIISDKLDHSSPKVLNLDKDQKLTIVLSQLNDSMIALKKSLRPSIFKPIQFIKFIFSKNGY